MGDFSLGLLGSHLAEDNPLVSPVSAYIALTMAGMGARGRTLGAFERVLGKDFADRAQDALMNLEPEGEEPDSPIISMANSVWLSDAIPAGDKRFLEWGAKVAEKFRSRPFRADLASLQAIQDINSWVRGETKGLIPALLVEPITPDVAMALMNAVYFKATWKYAFYPEDTKRRLFKLGDGRRKYVRMMGRYRQWVDYIENDYARGVILPYIGDPVGPGLWMVALMPKGDGLTIRDVWAALSKGLIAEVEKTLSPKIPTFANLRLPKFSAECRVELKDGLTDMGLGVAFSKEQADFTGLYTSRGPVKGIWIGQTLQKARVSVGEDGTEAAAATEVEMFACLGGMPMDEPEPIDIFFDRPFMYMIVTDRMEMPLFVGIMDNPAA